MYKKPGESPPAPILGSKGSPPAPILGSRMRRGEDSPGSFPVPQNWGLGGLSIHTQRPFLLLPLSAKRGGAGGGRGRDLGFIGGVAGVGSLLLPGEAFLLTPLSPQRLKKRGDAGRVPLGSRAAFQNGLRVNGRHALAVRPV